jgi:hypothetical protein
MGFVTIEMIRAMAAKADISWELRFRQIAYRRKRIGLGLEK